MKNLEHNVVAEYVENQTWMGGQDRTARPGLLHLVTEHDLGALRQALAKGEVPPDFAAKLLRLAGDSLLQRFVEQNCRLFIALLLAAQDGSFSQGGPAERERLLRVLAYVRRDEDAIPDYRAGGFLDDQQEVRAATAELAPLLRAFKAWRLQHQVPGMWRG